MSPSALRWGKYSGRRRKSLKMFLIERHNNRCHHCGVECVKNTSFRNQSNSATIDHIIPRSELPESEWFNRENVVLSCFACNQRRSRKKRAVEAAA